MTEQEALRQQLRAMVEKARRTLRAAQGHLAQGDAEFAASKAYDAAFHLMQAVLLTKGKTYSKPSSRLRPPPLDTPVDPGRKRSLCYTTGTMKRIGPTLTRRLRGLGVALVYLYGSEALGRASRLSDVDAGIVVQDPRRLRDRRRRTQLWLELNRCLTPVLTPGETRELDLVLLQAASPSLQFQAIRAGRPLFVADRTFQADYEAEVIRDYLDIRPLVEAHYQTVLDRAA